MPFNYTPENNTWSAFVSLFEEEDPVEGGIDGVDNIPLKQLADRSRWLFNQVDAIKQGTGLNDLSVTTQKLADNAVTRPKVAAGVIPSAYRNTVLTGPVDANGLPTALVKVTDTTWRVQGATKNIVVSFAAGFDAKGAIDHVGIISTDTTQAISGDVGPESTEYVFAERNTGTGAVTVGITNLAPVFSYVSPTSPATNQLWFDLGDMVMYRRSAGGAWVAVQVVIIGEIYRTDFIIASANCYEYRAPIEVFSDVPAGSLLPSASTTPPRGYLKCNGQAVSRSTYARLFRAIGTTFGVGNGTTTFNLPDLRGEFIRGFDDGRGVDPGRVFGSRQSGTILPIDNTGTSQLYVSAFTSTAVTPGNAETVAQRTGLDLDNNGATNYPNTAPVYVNGEGSGGFFYGVARPRNVALNFYIKF